MRRPLSLLSPRAVALVLVVLGLLAGACGDGIAPPAAEVNGNAITQVELDDELESIGANAEYVEFLESQGNTIFGAAKGTFAADFVRRVLTRQIYLELVHEEYVRRKLRAVTKEDRDLVEQNVAREVGGPEILEKFDARYRTMLLDRSAEVAKLQLDMAGEEIDDETIRTFYEQNQELFVQTCARHILFAVIGADGNVDTEATGAQSATLQAEAQAAKARVNAGEDFAALARELSDDTGSKESGGDLG
ncbi:MAG TPA: peptidylprolyl isomerase, partial [Acidimicrobiales bacterium]